MFHLVQCGLSQHKSPIVKALASSYTHFVSTELAKRCQRIFTVSEFIKDELIQRRKFFDKSIEEKTEVLYHGIESSFREPMQGYELVQVKQKYNLPSQFILSVTNTWERKNLHGLLIAFDEYLKTSEDKNPLVLAGVTKQTVTRKLEDLDLEHLRKSVVALGFVDHRDMPAIYRLAHYFVFASLEESFGLPLLEAMACETPIITSNSSSLVEIAWGAARFVDPEIPQHFAKAMIDYDADSPKKRHFVEQGLKQIDKFSWEKSALRMIKIINEVLEEYTPKETKK